MIANDSAAYRAAFFEVVPFLIEKAGTPVGGYTLSFANILKRLDNIDITLVESQEATWGSKKGLAWNGALGMIQRDEADFSLIPCTLNGQRFRDFATSIQFLDSRMNILFGTKTTSEVSFYSLLDVKMCLGFVGAAIVIYGLSKLNQVYGHRIKSALPSMFLLQCLVGTSPQSLKVEGKVRFLAVLWSLVSFVLLANVSSTMTSQFATKTEDIPFDSFDDVFRFPTANPILIRGAATNNYVTKNALTDPGFHEVMRRVENNGDFSYPKLSVVMTRSAIHSEIEKRRSFVISTNLVVWNIIKLRFTSTGNCQMRVSKNLRVSFWNIYFKKNISSTFLRTVNRRLRQLTEGDCFEDLNPTLKSDLHPCRHPEPPPIFEIFDMTDFWIVFRVCLVGFSLGPIALILEIYYHMLKDAIC